MPLSQHIIFVVTIMKFIIIGNNLGHLNNIVNCLSAELYNIDTQ